MDKITIITVVYNGAQTIGRTIESVLSQTYQNIEYIIIDGNSNDGTIEIIEKYSNRLARFVSEKDSGIYNAMNKGLLYATGEWVMFLNSDDYLSSSSALSSVMMDKACVADSDILCCDYIIDKEGIQYRKAPRISNPNIAKKTLLRRMFVSHPATMVRRHIMQDYRFNESYSISADFDLFRLLFAAGRKFSYINYPLTVYSAGGFADKHYIKMICENSRIVTGRKYSLYFCGELVRFLMYRIRKIFTK